jgi:hypothetical protein
MTVVQPAATRGHLTPDEIARYHHNGFLAPIPVMPPSDMADHLRELEVVEARGAGRLAPAHNIKAHLLIPALWDLVHDPRVVDPVAALVGPDVLCLGAGFFDKRPGDAHHVPWHQDATYWGLSAPRALTAWLAFTPSFPENGCLRVSPGTHSAPLPHANTHDPTNMLPGRETVLAPVNEAEAVDVVLRPGQMSVHHVLLVHGSRANQSDQRRCGFAIRYIAGDLRKSRGPRGTATLVHGQDHGTFDLEEPPEGLFHPAALRRYTSIVRRWMRDVFDEFEREPGRGNLA